MPYPAILHCDLNNFYASCECALNPALRDVPLAVCGDPEKRHGIVLAKNALAKQCGVKTAEPIWQAKQKCPDLITVPPQFDLYFEYSRRVQAIYLELLEVLSAKYGLTQEDALAIAHLTSDIEYSRRIYKIVEGEDFDVWNQGEESLNAPDMSAGAEEQETLLDELPEEEAALDTEFVENNPIY